MRLLHGGDAIVSVRSRLVTGALASAPAAPAARRAAHRAPYARTRRIAHPGGTTMTSSGRRLNVNDARSHVARCRTTYVRPFSGCHETARVFLTDMGRIRRTRARTQHAVRRKPACRETRRRDHEPRSHRQAQWARSLRLPERRARSVTDAAGQPYRGTAALSLAAGCIELISLVRKQAAIGVNMPSPDAYAVSTNCCPIAGSRATHRSDLARSASRRDRRQYAFARRLLRTGASTLLRSLLDSNRAFALRPPSGAIPGGASNAQGERVPGPRGYRV